MPAPVLDTSSNSSFSRLLPGLQLYVDSTSLGEFKKCPRSYFYSIIQGYQSKKESPHLTFGILLHGGSERYWHARTKGQDHLSSTCFALDWVLNQTWDKDLGRGWISDHPQKTRESLVRTLVWYLDEVAQHDALKTLVLANGKPAVELSFSFDSGVIYESTGESVYFCGHLDRIGVMAETAYIVDIKTTGGALAPSFFAGFSPDNQFSLYTLAGRVAFNTRVAGVIVDGVQVGATFARFQRQPIERSEATISEWLGAQTFWLRQMENCAETGHWPQNDKACGMYGGCKFRGICSKSPSARELWLTSDFKKRQWNPLERRGDV